jgi:anti-sigma B factor antagonist
MDCVKNIKHLAQEVPPQFIIREDRQDQVLLRCSGRLDATSTDHLADYMERLVREGNYHVAMDLTHIEYLSSAGIRVWSCSIRNCRMNGMFYITESSENVAPVLGMVGMAKMFSGPEHKSAPGAEVKEKEFVSKAHGYSFRMQMLNDKASTTVKCPGSPQKIITPGYNESDTRIVVARQGAYALGLGALGDSFQACSERFGEYVLLNGTALTCLRTGPKSRII